MRDDAWICSYGCSRVQACPPFLSCYYVLTPHHSSWLAPFHSLVRGLRAALMHYNVGAIVRWQFARMNVLTVRFPLGTFAANMLGVLLYGATLVLQARLATPTLFAVAVLTGIRDGFCGCLTTVSTLVVELTHLGQRQAFIYLLVSLAVAELLLLVMHIASV